MADSADTRTSTGGLGLLTGLAKTTVAGGVDVSVDIGGTTVTARTLRHAAVTAGDVVLIARQGSAWWVMGLTQAAAPPAPAVDTEDKPPTPKPVTKYGYLVIAPVETRSYRDGDWRTNTDDTYQGQYGGGGNYTGAAFYGQKPSSLTGATCTSASVKLRREKGSGDYDARRVTLWTCSQTIRPGGNVTRLDSTTGPSMAVNTTTQFDLPTAWGQDFIDGDAGSLACYDADGDPYLRLSGRGSWSSAWVLIIHWSKTS